VIHALRAAICITPFSRRHSHMQAMLSVMPRCAHAESLVCDVSQRVLAAHGASLTPEAAKAGLGKRPLEAWQAVVDVLGLAVPAQQLYDESEPLLTERRVPSHDSSRLPLCTAEEHSDALSQHVHPPMAAPQRRKPMSLQSLQHADRGTGGARRA
jgi:hypothetical protein